MAPLIAALIKFGAPLLAGAVVSKGKEVIQEKLGVNLDEVLGSEEGRIKIRQLEIDHQEFLVTAAQASEARDFESFKVEVEDRKSARDRDSWYIRAGIQNWRAHAMFGIAVGLVIWLVYLTWKAPEVSEFAKGIITLLLGRALGWLDNIYNFEFGTTRASRAKDDTIEALSKGEKS